MRREHTTLRGSAVFRRQQYRETLTCLVIALLRQGARQVNTSHTTRRRASTPPALILSVPVGTYLVPFITPFIICTSCLMRLFFCSCPSNKTPGIIQPSVRDFLIEGVNRAVRVLWVHVSDSCNLTGLEAKSVLVCWENRSSLSLSAVYSGCLTLCVVYLWRAENVVRWSLLPELTPVTSPEDWSKILFVDVVFGFFKGFFKAHHKLFGAALHTWII